MPQQQSRCFKVIVSLGILNILLLIYPLLLTGILQIPLVRANMPGPLVMKLYDHSHLSFHPLSWGVTGAVVILLMALGLARRGPAVWAATGFALASVLVWTGLQAVVHENRYNNIVFKDLVFENHNAFSVPQILQSSILKPRHVDSFADYAKYMQKLYGSLHGRLQTDWPVRDEAQRKTFFYLTVVANLWAFGNGNRPDLLGCVAGNEIIGWDGEKKSLDIKDYLSSEIGCCADYAHVLAQLLMAEGVKVRLVNIPDQHVFNEVWFDGQWNVVDATTGLVFYSSWDQMMNRPIGAKIRLTEFKHPGFKISGRYYRGEQIKDLKLLMLKWATTRSQRFVELKRADLSEASG